SILFGLLSGYFLKLLKHRGFLHSIRFSLFYGIVVYISARYGMLLDNENSFFLSCSSVSGVIVHLLLDKEIKF
ncbi:MAG: metal-dependent hydrolase, partial [Thermotogaceae bacterium]|nr:metal-dependent hydrolase [Thermotogaceae bacterium]